MDTAVKVARPAPIALMTFTPETHTYKVGGVEKISVTQLLKPIQKGWDFLDQESLAWYQDRGTMVHLATALDDLGDLVEESVHPEIRGYLNSWRAFRADPSIQILSVEEPVYHPTYAYAGMLDRRLMIKGRHAVLDIKAGGQMISHAVQNCGYRRAWNHNKPKSEHVVDSYTCYLSRDGALPKLVQWVDPLHDDMFLALLTFARWDRKYK